MFKDFLVKWDENPEIVTKRILKSIILNRLRNRKPAIMFISGDSGEGKSYSALRLQELLFEIEGLKLTDYLEACNVFYPIEYPKKLDALLFNKELRPVKILCMHEARTVIKAKLWYSFLNQAISDVNAMSRSVKRLCIMVISQFIRDISTDIRYTLNYYIKVHRPGGGKARLQIYVMWKDDRDLENPKLKKRRLTGYLIMPNGRHRRFTPLYLELNKPSEEAQELFEKLDTESKSTLLKRKMDKLIDEMEKEMGVETNKINKMVDHYMKNDETLMLIAKRKGRRWILTKEAQQMHALQNNELKEFEEKLNLAFKKKQEAERQERVLKEQEAIARFEDGMEKLEERQDTARDTPE